MTYAKLPRWFAEYPGTMNQQAFVDIYSEHTSAYLERVKRSGLAPRTISGRYFAIRTGSIEWLLDPALIGRLKIGQTNQVSLGDDAV